MPRRNRPARSLQQPAHEPRDTRPTTTDQMAEDLVRRGLVSVNVLDFARRRPATGETRNQLDLIPDPPSHMGRVE